MHCKYQEQLEIKKHICASTIKKISNINVSNLSIIPSISSEYRNKVSVPFQMIDNKISYGFYKNRTHEIIQLEDCRVQSKINDDILLMVKNLLKEFKISIYDEVTHQGDFRHCIVRNNYDNSQFMVVLIAREYNSVYDTIAERIYNKFDYVKSVVLNINELNNNVILGKRNITLRGNDHIIDKIDDLSFKIGASSFYQINKYQIKNLYQTAINLANLKKTDIVIDAYCGIGTISLFLAKNVRFVYGLEIVEEAIKNANENKELNDIKNVQFLEGDVLKTINKIVSKRHIDAIVLDPPRKGCGKEFLDIVIKNKIDKIIYISCGIKGLAMDLNVLKEYYDIKEIKCVDMFPNTEDVETVCLLSLKNIHN
jgi:23S rRNA (uracil1939-C5)-methyltransferase